MSSDNARLPKGIMSEKYLYIITQYSTENPAYGLRNSENS